MTSEAPRRRRRTWIRLGLGILALAALFVVGRAAGDRLDDFARWVDDLGVWGPLVFAAGYAAAVVAFAPASLLTLAAGAIFGVLEGTLIVFVAATLGACAAFVLARTVARRPIERRLEGDQRFARIDRAVGREGRKIVFLLRLSPIFPYNLLNYALGLTGVRFADYALACLGMLPGTLLYVYLGSAAGNLAEIAAGERAATDTQQRLIFYAGLAVTAVVTVAVTRIARRALQEEVEAEDDGRPATEVRSP